MDMKATIGGRLHSMLYYLAIAMRPRMLMTLDGEGALLPAPVRVGQAVDVVAQAGRPKSITGSKPSTTIAWPLKLPKAPIPICLNDEVNIDCFEFAHTQSVAIYRSSISLFDRELV